jgi:hypothetical protein
LWIRWLSIFSILASKERLVIKNIFLLGTDSTKRYIDFFMSE